MQTIQQTFRHFPLDEAMLTSLDETQRMLTRHRRIPEVVATPLRRSTTLEDPMRLLQRLRNSLRRGAQNGGAEAEPRQTRRKPHGSTQRLRERMHPVDTQKTWLETNEKQNTPQKRWVLGDEITWLWINTYENTIFSGMNIHKSQLF